MKTGEDITPSLKKICCKPIFKVEKVIRAKNTNSIRIAKKRL